MASQVLLAGFWGSLAGSSLVIGALLGYYTKIPTRWIAGIMAFGSGPHWSVMQFSIISDRM